MCIALDARRVRFLRIDVVLRFIIINDDDRYREQGRCCSLDVGTVYTRRNLSDARQKGPRFRTSNLRALRQMRPKSDNKRQSVARLNKPRALGRAIDRERKTVDLTL